MKLTNLERFAMGIASTVPPPSDNSRGFKRSSAVPVALTLACDACGDPLTNAEVDAGHMLCPKCRVTR